MKMGRKDNSKGKGSFYKLYNLWLRNMYNKVQTFYSDYCDICLSYDTIPLFRWI